MIYPSILERKYNEYSPFVEEVSKKARETLLNFCERKAYAFTYRIKSIESLAEKIETGRFKKWSDLNDLFACTVIIPTLSHEQEVLEFCKTTFEIIKTVKRGQNKKSPDTFRFDSTRIYARLKKNGNLFIDDKLSIYKVSFEIQIKSAFEHAWSVSTHDLVYKNSEIDWRKLRLAAQIKASVEQLDMLILAFEQTSEFIQKNDFNEIKTKCYIATEINNELFAKGKIPDELKPKDMSRFCDNLYYLLSNVTEKPDIKSTIKQIITKIQSTKTNQIPLSISLFQYFIAILVDNKIVTNSIEKYYWNITQEVVTLYPSLKEVSSIFEYDENA